MKEQIEAYKKVHGGFNNPPELDANIARLEDMERASARACLIAIGADPLKACSWCEPDKYAEHPFVSHGVCQECKVKVLESVRRLKAEHLEGMATAAEGNPVDKIARDCLTEIGEPTEEQP
jgi:hypothetical protein